MSFRFKNAGATYQRAIQACFKRGLNKNVEAYVDDMVVKTRNSSTLIADLEETFASLREYSWKLNPNKCVFGVPSGKLLGFIIRHRGIEANPEKNARTSWRRSTKSSTATMRLHVRWSARLSNELSIGPQPWAMLRNSSEGAKGASTSPSNNMSRPTS
jgi:hypothetical protein